MGGFGPEPGGALLNWSKSFLFGTCEHYVDPGKQFMAFGKYALSSGNDGDDTNHEALKHVLNGMKLKKKKKMKMKNMMMMMMTKKKKAMKWMELRVLVVVLGAKRLVFYSFSCVVHFC